ncbi:ATP-binding protein [Myxococcota bacterium]|nr:ATP-binding protein [Myxococcota bacterium]MBU1379688.1 ATP-binding protein [Myxococcota bacterium]MBU1496899.1 ATP-binding protein [Myxococcota bacterium]
MKELVIISGKGGTGKTSVTASLATLAENAVICDCDVDAPDLHLILKPEIIEKNEFISGNIAIINQDKCIRCGRCMELCTFGAISNKANGKYVIDSSLCEGCMVCVKFCPANAIDFPERMCGHWMVSKTKSGPMVHAKLGNSSENSGKLVSTVRKKAFEISQTENLKLIITDGPPGTGCPVISSLTGATHCLIVTEPTVSGLHDTQRVFDLLVNFKIKTFLTVNKWDLNKKITSELEIMASSQGVLHAGHIRYDPCVTQAQMKYMPVVEMNCGASRDIKKIWSNLRKEFDDE